MVYRDEGDLKTESGANATFGRGLARLPMRLTDGLKLASAVITTCADKHGQHLHSQAPAQCCCFLFDNMSVQPHRILCKQGLRRSNALNPLLPGRWPARLPCHTRADQPDLYISMPRALLSGQPVAGAPAGEVEESDCAAACRAAADCNIFFWCPAVEGCSTNLTNATGSGLPYRHCRLAQEPNSLPGQAQPPEAVAKGEAVAVTSGALRWVQVVQARAFEGD